MFLIGGKCLSTKTGRSQFIWHWWLVVALIARRGIDGSAVTTSHNNCPDTYPSICHRTTRSTRTSAADFPRLVYRILTVELHTWPFLLPQPNNLRKDSPLPVRMLLELSGCGYSSSSSRSSSSRSWRDGHDSSYNSSGSTNGDCWPRFVERCLSSGM